MTPIFTELCQPDTLLFAWEEVFRKGSKGGVDRQTVESFAQKADLYLQEIREELLAGTYTPEPYLKIEIAKSDRETRTLGLATVRDKIVQLAVKNLIEPKIEPMFLNVSYAYRRNKSTYKAIRRVQHAINAEKKFWFLRADIDNFFDTVDHTLLLEKLTEKSLSLRLSI
jgi:retron-type reverse transcriptase